MTGGAGFSMSGNRLVKDNRNLGKIRPNPSVSHQYDYNSNMGLVDKKSLDQAIQIRIERKEKTERNRKWIFRILLLGGILLTAILFLLS